MKKKWTLIRCGFHRKNFFYANFLFDARSRAEGNEHQILEKVFSMETTAD